MCACVRCGGCQHTCGCRGLGERPRVRHREVRRRCGDSGEYLHLESARRRVVGVSPHRCRKSPSRFAAMPQPVRGQACLDRHTAGRIGENPLPFVDSVDVVSTAVQQLPHCWRARRHVGLAARSQASSATDVFREPVVGDARGPVGHRDRAALAETEGSEGVTHGAVILVCVAAKIVGALGGVREDRTRDAPQPRGIPRKPYPGLVRGCEPS